MSEWYKTAKEWVCTECGGINPIKQDYCSTCDCSLDSFLDENIYLMEKGKITFKIPIKKEGSKNPKL